MIPAILIELFAEARVLLSVGRSGLVAYEEGMAAGAAYASENVSMTSVASIIYQRYGREGTKSDETKPMSSSAETFFFVASRAYFKTLSNGMKSQVISDASVDKLTLKSLLSPMFMRASDEAHSKVTAFLGALNQQILSSDPAIITSVGTAIESKVDGAVNLDFIADYLSNPQNVNDVKATLQKLGLKTQSVDEMLARLATKDAVSGYAAVTQGLKDVLAVYKKEGKKIFTADTWIGLMRGAFIQYSGYNTMIVPKERTGHMMLNAGCLPSYSAEEAIMMTEISTRPRIATTITQSHIRAQESKTLKNQGWIWDEAAEKLIAPIDVSSSITGRKVSPAEVLTYATKLLNKR
jgi:hypothetical protein